MNASRQSLPVSAVMCTGLATLFVTRYLLVPFPVEAPFEGGMPLASALVRFTAHHSWLASATAVLIVAWTLLLVVQMTVKYSPAGIRNYLPAQIFLVAAAGIVASDEPLAALTAAWLLTLAMRRSAFSFHKGYAFSELFHTGFYLGLIPLLYAPAAVIVLPAAIAALSIYRRSGREAVVCLAGLLLPVPVAGFIHWAAGASGDFIYRELWRCAVEPRTPWREMPLGMVAVAVPVLILAFTGMFWVLWHKKSIRKAQYKFMRHASFVMFLIAASATVPGSSATVATLAALPCALGVPYAFQGKLAVTSTLLYCAVLLAVFALNLLPVLDI